MKEYRLNPLISREQIASIVEGLAKQISKDYAQRDVVVVCILKGAFMFLSDLVRHLRIPVQIDFARLASYGSGIKSSGLIEITKDIEISVEGKDVLIVEDIQEVLTKEVKAVRLKNVTQGATYAVKCDVQDRQRAIIKAGGLLNYTKTGGKA